MFPKSDSKHMQGIITFGNNILLHFDFQGSVIFLQIFVAAAD